MIKGGEGFFTESTTPPPGRKILTGMPTRNLFPVTILVRFMTGLSEFLSFIGALVVTFWTCYGVLCIVVGLLVLLILLLLERRFSFCSR